jgi:hypothetical protein
MAQLVAVAAQIEILPEIAKAEVELWDGLCCQQPAVDGEQTLSAHSAELEAVDQVPYVLR